MMFQLGDIACGMRDSMSEKFITSEPETGEDVSSGGMLRRDFLKKSALAGLGVTALYVAP